MEGREDVRERVRAITSQFPFPHHISQALGWSLTGDDLQHLLAPISALSLFRYHCKQSCMSSPCCYWIIQVLLLCSILQSTAGFLLHKSVVPSTSQPLRFSIRLHNNNSNMPTKITEVKTSNAPAPVGPYSQAVLAGSTLYVSGNIALDPQTGQIVGGGDVQAETKQVLQNLDAVLKEAGATPQQVVRCTVFLADLGDFSAVNEIYADYFKDNAVAPSRSCVQVAALPKGVKVEIDCIAEL
jgi:2-iminobutanoate/2-iminopropanoate deaminase